MGEGSEGTAYKQCGLTETIVFFIAIVSGTACSICSKTMMELKGEGIDGDIEVFQKPIFQTFGMFIGMMFGLIMHWFVLFFKLPFPGYEFTPPPPPQSNGYATEKDSLLANGQNGHNNNNTTEKKIQANGEGGAGKGTYIPWWMYFFLAIPAIFDLAATAFCMMGLVYLDVSIYQLLRGSGIIFVALMKQYVLRHKLYTFQWVGVAWNVVSVLLVGSTAMLNSSDESAKYSAGQSLLGVLLVLVGAFTQALQFVFEEKVMTMDIPSPPLLLIGMEGFWGTFLCVVLVYPLCYYLPGDDHGSYEDPFNTWHMFMHSTNIQWSFLIYFVVIFSYNFFAVLVTYMLNSVWHAILDNFRPITIWSTDLFIFYVIASSGDFGEPWTKWSFVQLIGMCVLLYGTSVYNAPNTASIKLQGEWFSFGMNFSQEYKQIEDEEKEAEIDEEWAKRQAEFKTRKESSFLGERSPHVSVHTQALRGLGVSHN